MITWNEKTVSVNDLKPYERNPRRIGKEAFEKLKKSLQDNGYHQRIIATPDFRIIGGHQRIKALKEVGIKKIAVLVPHSTLCVSVGESLIKAEKLTAMLMLSASYCSQACFMFHQFVYGVIIYNFGWKYTGV